MADYVFEERRQNYNLTGRANWGAIWAGVFTFFAIWSVFGVLGMAIFASAANPNTEHPVGGMGAGMGIWSVILTIIAMFVAGRVTGHLAGAGNWRDGVSHGMIMFGLSVIGTLLLVLEGSAALGAPAEATAGGVHGVYLFSVLANIGWAGFFALLLGWLAAMGGASAGARSVAPTTTTQQTRRAA